MSDIKHEPMIETARRVIAEHRETLEALHKGETSSMPGWLLSIAVRAGCSAEEFDQLREYAKQAAELARQDESNRLIGLLREAHAPVRAWPQHRDLAERIKAEIEDTTGSKA